MPLSEPPLPGVDNERGRHDIPVMAKAVEKAILEGLPLTDAVVPYVNLTALPDRLKPAEEFLKALDKTIHIPLEGAECQYDVRRDRIEMCPPWCLASLDSFSPFAITNVSTGLKAC